MALSDFQKLARRLKIKKADYGILQHALTHKSYLGETSELENNERMEFLGDSVLGLIVAEHLYSRFTEQQEGELAKAKAVTVSEPILAEAAKKLGLSSTILVSAGEDQSGGRNRSSILSDAFEAVVAAVYLIGGLDAARVLVLKALRPLLDDIEREEHHRNYKSILQELSQSLYKKAPRYELVRESGADHDKTFMIEARLDGTPLGRGEGKSKKQAEQAAARQSLLHPIFERNDQEGGSRR